LLHVACVLGKKYVRQRVQRAPISSGCGPDVNQPSTTGTLAFSAIAGERNTAAGVV
jgi:hypothetical protein